MDQIEVGGLNIACGRAGHGPALLLLHGAYCDSRVWRMQLEEVSDDFTVLAWDAPGCGMSSDPPDTWRLTEYANCLAAFIEAADLESSAGSGRRSRRDDAGLSPCWDQDTDPRVRRSRPA
jgi:pimeloyl-ACP methyl ester carboxylesterase